jgi:hypothetical protein
MFSTDSANNLPEWHVDSLEQLRTSSSDEEFFDAQGLSFTVTKHLPTNLFFPSLNIYIPNQNST